VVLTKLAPRNIFASADDGVFLHEITKLGAWCERAVHGGCDFSEGVALRKQGSGAGFFSSCGEPGNLTFDQREVKAADARRFADAEDSIY
jgi:hypothetical protein